VTASALVGEHVTEMQVRTGTNQPSSVTQDVVCRAVAVPSSRSEPRASHGQVCPAHHLDRPVRPTPVTFVEFQPEGVPMRRFLLTAAVMLAATTTTVIAQSAPADAASYPGTAGKLTLWQNDGYQGQQLSRSDYDDNLHNDACSGCDPGPGGNFGDDASSFVNKSKYWWYVYVNKQEGNSGGTSYCVRPYSHDADLGNNGYEELEDEISAMRRSSTTGSTPPEFCGPGTIRPIIGRSN
jgi:hypothetical protein